MAGAIDDAFAESSKLTEGQKAAIRFADAFLVNEAGSASLLHGFDATQRFELCVGLALFHAFSKVMIVLGLEPEPGSMAVTELATPDTDRPATSLEAGLENLGAACAAEVGAHGDMLDLARLRIGQVLGVLDGSRPPSTGREAFLDLVELFVIDVHAVTDELFAAAVDGLDPAVVVSLLIGLAHADAVSRIERCAVRQVDMTR